MTAAAVPLSNLIKNGVRSLDALIFIDEARMD